MSDLICWNCSARTPVGNCISCGALIKSAEDIFNEKEKEIQKRVIEIRRKGRKAYYLNLQELNEIVGNNFTIVRSIHLESPKYLVEDPGMALAESFETLITDSSKLLLGLTPKVERISKNSNHLLIQYAFIEPTTVINNRRSVLLILATFLSMIISGFVNSTNINNSQGIGTLLIILLIKDLTQIYIGKRFFDLKSQTFFVPAPPIFELGTIGSFVGNLSIHKSKSSMFYTSLIGPMISWIISGVILILSMGTLDSNPVAAEKYSDNSILQNGTYEPLFLKYAAGISNALLGTNIGTDQAITTSYLFNPISLAALAGIYISGISLLPLSFLNGGQVVRSKLGKLPHLLLTYIMIIISIFYNVIFSFFLILVHQRLGVPDILNDESKMNSLSTILLFIVFLIGILTMPIPLNWIY
ncbi:MAG: hypothetical protein ACW99A_23170 [Candidatus Kariarchaeaceae archaeon]